MYSVPVNKQIAIFVGPCCGNAHAQYLDILAASPMAVRTLAVIDESHELHAKLSEALVVQLNTDTFSTEANEIAKVIGDTEYTRIGNWLKSQDAEEQSDEVKEPTVDLSHVQIGLLSVDITENGKTENKKYVLNPLPKMQGNESAEELANISLKHYQAESLRLELELRVSEMNRINVSNDAAKAIAERFSVIESQLVTLTGAVTELQEPEEAIKFKK